MLPDDFYCLHLLKPTAGDSVRSFNPTEIFTGKEPAKLLNRVSMARCKADRNSCSLQIRKGLPDLELRSRRSPASLVRQVLISRASATVEWSHGFPSHRNFWSGCCCYARNNQ